MQRKLVIGLLALVLAISNFAAAGHHHADSGGVGGHRSGNTHGAAHGDACAVCTALHAPAVAPDSAPAPAQPGPCAIHRPVDPEAAPHASLVHLAPNRAPPSA